MLHIIRAKNPIKSTFTMHTKTLETVSFARYIGVDLFINLSVDTHINRIESNANAWLGFIRRNIKTKHEGVREAAYQTIVRPQLEYLHRMESILSDFYTENRYGQ